ELPGDCACANEAPADGHGSNSPCRVAVRSAAFAHDQIDRADMVLGAGGARLDHLEHDVGGAFAKPSRIDGDASEAWNIVLRLDHVVEADDGEVTTRFQAVAAQAKHGAKGDSVVETERGGRRRFGRQRQVDAGHAALAAGIAFEHLNVTVVKAVYPAGFAESAEPLLIDYEIGRAAEEGDAAMSLAEEVPRR